MKIKIAVCDSDKQVLDYLRDMIIRQQPAAEVMTFSSAEGLLQSGTDFAIYILDVKGVDGMEIASILRSREQVARSIIIFVTGYREYMPAAFDVQAFHYVNLIIGYLAFRYMEVILTGRFAKRRTALWGWLAVYTAGQTGISWGIDALGSSQAGAYGGMVQLIPCALLLLMLQKYYFHRNWPRQIFALASFIAGWGGLRFAVSPLSYVLFDFWHPLWNWLVEYSVAQGLISAERLLFLMGMVNQLALLFVLAFCRLVQLGIFALYLWLMQKYFCGRDYELSWTESSFLLAPCVTVLAIDN